MLESDQELINEIIIEARDNIEAAINNILLLEDNPDDTETINALFRNFHTIKGSASVVNFEKIIRLTHEAETLLDNIRDQTVAINSQIIEVLLKSADVLKNLVNEVDGGSPFSDNKLNLLINILSAYLPRESLPEK